MAKENGVKMIPNWPINCENPEEVWGNNEAYGTGRYPISQNNHWHSGIHLNYLYGTLPASCKVFPFLNGELVAYRISRDYKKVPRQNEIPKSVYDRLSGREKEYYFQASIFYSLKKDIEENKRYENYSNSFILLKHSFFAKRRGNTTLEKTDFFTLYTNIIPVIYEQFNTFVSIDMVPKQIPFYCRYCFRVDPSTGDMPVYNKEKRVNGSYARDKEFFLLWPEIFLSTQGTSTEVFPVKPVNGSMPQHYIKKENTDRYRIQVKVELDDTYVLDSVEAPSRTVAIYSDMLLGFADLSPSYNNPYFDVALLFNNINFINSNLEQVNRYLIYNKTVFKLSDNNTSGPLVSTLFNGLGFFEATGKEIGRGNIVYSEFLYNGKKYYLPKNEVSNIPVENMLDFRKFFRVLNRETANTIDFTNGLEFIKATYNWNADNVGRYLRDSKANWWNERDESRETKSIKRSIICGHPLEWDKDIYVNGDGRVNQQIKNSYGIRNSDEELFIKRLEAIDVWTELGNRIRNKPINGINTRNNFWFAHPVYFINHLNKAGVLDKSFNPYENQRLPSFNRDTTGRAWLPLENWSEATVLSNPGFAPTVSSITNAINSQKIGGYYFSGLNQYTSPYGILRRNPNGNHSKHTGIDISTAGERTPIIALIQGVVWACSTVRESNTFGKVMFIKSKFDDNLYILMHLHNFIKNELDQVEPGEIVAITGNTGESTGIHLHVEVYVDIPDNRGRVLNVDNIKDGSARDSWFRITNVNNHRRDPFNHRIHLV